MENKFFTALRYNDSYTENGMPTHSSSGSYVLDMFFKMGGSRGMSISDIEKMFERALLEDKVLAIKGMFYNRDIRGGQGERRSFRAMFEFLCREAPELAQKVFKLVPEYGRWDDVLIAVPYLGGVSNFIYKALRSGDVLAKKWMPRENKANKKLALRLIDSFGIGKKEYRKLISLNGQVVENLMCDNEWGDINYNHVPSIASKNYRHAFSRHDGTRYGEWLTALEKGEKGVKINAGAIFPHTIIKPYLDDIYSRSIRLDRTVEQQWKALPDYVKEGLSFIPVVDVSGSMYGLPIEVSVSLGIYLAERNKSVFKDGFITFSAKPTLQILKGNTLADRVGELKTAKWDMNTNLEAVFKLILDKAIRAKLDAKDLPTHIVILSDMQFDQCVQNSSDNVMEMIRRMYSEAGYTVPQVIFWNLDSKGGIPVQFNESGTCIVSGFSPSVMQSMMNGDLNPMSMMNAVLNSERYAAVEKALNEPSY